MFERLMSRLIEDDIPTIALFAEPGVVKMYSKFGFVSDPDGVKGIAFQRRSKQGQQLVAEAANDARLLKATETPVS